MKLLLFIIFIIVIMMQEERRRFHSRLTELLSIKNSKDYATTVTWLRAEVSQFGILRSALLC